MRRRSVRIFGGERSRAGFLCRTLAAGFAAAWLLAGTAGAEPRVSSIVVNADTGQVLAASAPDAVNYPASLTKMMTLYLTFQGLEGGQLKLDQRFTVTSHAAAQAPSKLGLA